MVFKRTGSTTRGCLRMRRLEASVFKGFSFQMGAGHMTGQSKSARLATVPSRILSEVEPISTMTACMQATCRYLYIKAF